MKCTAALATGLVLATAPWTCATAADLASRTWNHGAADCSTDRNPPVEVFALDEATYVLRQNKCVNFEAPFIYLLLGEHTAFLQDTGATAEADRFPLYETVRQLLDARGALTGRSLKLLVTHSHGHGDHVAGDAQFRGQPDVTLVEPELDAVRAHFGLTAWPAGEAALDLGGRSLVVIPAPGHHEQAVAVYDPRTQWLLTGDSVYPGRLYVFDWPAYVASIARLAAFARSHPVSAVVGTHIELAADGTQFEMGSTYQPGEASLVLRVADLEALDAALREAEGPREIATQRWVVTPIPGWQRVLGRVLHWLGAI